MLFETKNYVALFKSTLKSFPENSFKNMFGVTFLNSRDPSKTSDKRKDIILKAYESLKETLGISNCHTIKSVKYGL